MAVDFLINTVNNPWFFVGIAGLFGAYVLLLSTVLAVWTARDIKQRTHSPVARIGTPIFIFLFGFAGFLPYLVLRPRKTFDDVEDERREQLLLALPAQKALCPSCKKGIGEEYAYCPHCQAVFRPVCSCGATLEADWKRCAYCGADVPASAKNQKFVRPVLATQLQLARETANAPVKKQVLRELKVQSLASKIVETLRKQKTPAVAAKPVVAHVMKEVKKEEKKPEVLKQTPVAAVIPAKKLEPVTQVVKKEKEVVEKVSERKEKAPFLGQVGLSVKKLFAIKR
jgi:hypothetical protein